VRRDRLGPLEYALIDAGGPELELLHSTDVETPTGKFLAERGPGLHHLAYAVADLEAERRRLVDAGFEQSGEVRTGVHGTPIVFFHPRSVGGVLTELVERHG
jgi:methylmalonyl-CoA epimerase